MKIRKLICTNCGNTHDFIVDARQDSVCATLCFDDDTAELDGIANDINIFPIQCAKCLTAVSYSVVWTLTEKKACVCEKCKKRFSCFTEKSEEKCTGFEFDEPTVELEL